MTNTNLHLILIIFNTSYAQKKLSFAADTNHQNQIGNIDCIMTKGD